MISIKEIVTTVSALFILGLPSIFADTIVLKNGGKLSGKIVNENVSIVILATKHGKKAIAKSTIAEIKKEDIEQPVRSEMPSDFIKADDVTFLPGKKYVDTTIKAINSAKNSIYVNMYLTRGGLGRTEELIDSLITAKKRGVEVKVLLEGSNESFVQSSNEETYKNLKKGGVEVRFYPIFPIMHTKLIIVDDCISFLGSHNWTLAAMTINSESSVMIKSKTLGLKLGKYALANFSKGNKL